MLAISLWIAIALFSASMALCLYRMLIGPSIMDRILTLDTLSVNAMALIVLLGIQLGTQLFFEAAMLIAMMGFVGTVSLCKYQLRGNIIE